MRPVNSNGLGIDQAMPNGREIGTVNIEDLQVVLPQDMSHLR
jgi:hypothetical protein